MNPAQAAEIATSVSHAVGPAVYRALAGLAGLEPDTMAGIIDDAAHGNFGGMFDKAAEVNVKAAYEYGRPMTVAVDPQTPATIESVWARCLELSSCVANVEDSLQATFFFAATDSQGSYAEPSPMDKLEAISQTLDSCISRARGISMTLQRRA